MDLPYFAVLRARLDQMGERQRLIAENLANATTPNYRPRDLDTKAFERSLARISEAGGRLPLAVTSPRHMPVAKLSTSGGEITTARDGETTIDGNAVIIEDQMLKAGETRAAFETALTLYQKGLQLMRLAARAPGR